MTATPDRRGTTTLTTPTLWKGARAVVPTGDGRNVIALTVLTSARFFPARRLNPYGLVSVTETG
jgi:hypothetical protein